MPWWSEWLARRRRRNKATQFVATLFVEPLAEDVRWLAANGTDGDHDHAQWELRYARRALGLLVARELATALARDPNIASGKLRVAERQLNARLRAYGDALRRRDGAGTGWHLGRALLEFSGRREPVPPELVATAGDLLARYVTESNESLRDRFGVANLPQDVAPSALGAVTR